MALYKQEEIVLSIGETWKRDAVLKFAAKMEDKARPFPCIPATIGHQLEHFRYGFLPHPAASDSAIKLASALDEYAKHYQEFGNYTSLVLFYKDTDREALSVEQYEQLFWSQLNKSAKLDTAQWPDHIPKDAENPLWEFCFNGEQFFVYCGTPAHEKRLSRYFPYLILAITPRSVLVEFNSSKGRASKVKSDIRKRLAAYDTAPIHPDLNTYGNGDNYEWKQYFLRDDDTTLSRCPFHRYLKMKSENDV
ncbi:YqcI/YcgG family protein [Bacillus sp. FJAT-27445]|uniref:YqcI/YcgG family protein n=1 Tax=Bacillus sp. FJAT-27445 TaxID=1679166 RepID=UPI00074332F9|nr:YqcI/YcgG family protein [Bacillus sp. FJAT-27445]